jgi:hypothetical protein
MKIAVGITIHQGSTDQVGTTNVPVISKKTAGRAAKSRQLVN